MSRIFFNLMLVALPFAVYGLWAAFVAKKEKESGGTWDGAPLTWLLIIGLGLGIGSLFAARLMTDDVTDSAYSRPDLSDGETTPQRP